MNPYVVRPDFVIELVTERKMVVMVPLSRLCSGGESLQLALISPFIENFMGTSFR